MKVIYLPDSPMGELFFDPETGNAVGIDGKNIMCVGFKRGYDPLRDFRHKGAKELEMGDKEFSRLREAALNYGSAKREMNIALGPFQEHRTEPSKIERIA